MGASYQFSESKMLALRAVSSVPQVIGILLSLFRLWYRLRIRRLWWEDLWSFVACVCAIALLTSDWMYLEGDWLVSVVGLWMYSLVFTCVVWAVRMSILFSIARIVYATERMRRLVTALAALFSLFFVTFMVMKVWWYTQDLSWLKETASDTKPSRLLPHSMYVYELCVDGISDTILIFLPVRVLWSMNLPPKQRRMIIAIFSSSIIVTMVSILRAVSQIKNLVSLVGVAADFEAAFATINCNLLVIATLVYRFSRRVSSPDVSESDIEDDDYTTPVRGRVTPLTLTTVDLNALDYSNDGNQLAVPPASLKQDSILSH